MSTIFKIFVFLFLQQGGKIAIDLASSGMGIAVVQPFDAGAFAGPMVLTVQTDENTVNEILSICSLISTHYDVKKENINEVSVRTEISFKSLGSAEKARIMACLKPITNRIAFQWND